MNRASYIVLIVALIIQQWIIVDQRKHVEYRVDQAAWYAGAFNSCQARFETIKRELNECLSTKSCPYRKDQP